MATKTKNELLEEIEQKNTEIAELNEEIKKFDKYKQYDESADELRALFDSFVRTGFSDDQAFALLQTIMTMNSQTSVNFNPTFLRRI